jgi:arsenate reductase
VFNVLFLCTRNSARSVFAEALVNDARVGHGKFKGYSAGSQPAEAVHPLTIDTLAAAGFQSDGFHTKSWEEFAKPGAPRLDFVITVCDEAAAEQCPTWPGQPVTAHWSVPDPATVAGTERDKRRAFREALLELRRRIELFASLPIDKLDALALEKQLRDIGRR